MALGSDVKRQTKPEELEELLEGLEKLIERTKVLYEQYFMGIQKVAPMQMHRDIERKVRELTQQQIRNTGLRFRFSTLSQKFGSYNTYWKRTLREIEQGKYVRDLARVQRKADEAGEELPEELLVKLPRLVQDRIRRDRARLAERARRDADEATVYEAMVRATGSPVGEHQIGEGEAQALFDEGDLDLDGLFSAMTVPGTDALDDLDSLELTETPPQTRPPTANTSAPPSAGPSTEAPTAAPARRAAPTLASPSGRAGASTPPAASPGPAGASQRPTVPPTPASPSAPRATPPPTPPRSAKTTRSSIPIPPIAPRPSTPTESPAKTAGGPAGDFRVPAPPGPAKSSGIPPIPVPSSAPKPPPAAPPPRRRTEPFPAAAPPPPGMDDKQCRELYTRYLKARQLVGENNDDVTYEKLVSSLGKQAAAIMTEHGARGVEFHVVVRGDKVVLKAKPIKPDK